MAGLISQAQQTAPSPGQPQSEQAQNPQNAQQTADSQEAYDVAAGQMLSWIYDKAGVDALTRLIQSTGDPQAGMARLFGRLLMMTAQSAALAGKRIAPPLVFQAGIEAIRALSEVAQKQGLLDPANEKEVAETAFYDGVTLFATEAKEEALTPDEREQYAALLEKVEEMEQAGGMPQGEQSAQQPQEVPA